MTSKDTAPKVRYPSDLSDEEWAVLEPILEEIDPYTTGRPADYDRREILNAIFYLNKTGCPWRYLPKDFPSYKLVYYHYNRWSERGVLEQLNNRAARASAQKKGVIRSPLPRSSIVKVQRGHRSLPRGRLRRRQARQGTKAPYRCR